MAGHPELLAVLHIASEAGASDVFFIPEAPPRIKVSGKITSLDAPMLTHDEVHGMALSMLNPVQTEEFLRSHEYNLAYTAEGIARFRVNLSQEKRQTAIVARLVRTEIPDFDSLGVPPILKELALLSRGLVLVVGATGSGKSTTLAAMIDYRAKNRDGHILTIEDPIEYLFNHQRSTVAQREVGTDTESFAGALRNALRQAPDMIVIGEIRDRETMQHAISYSETGHLCLATLHANNANQTIKRIVNFFPEDARPQLQMDLSLNLKAVISQRLIAARKGGQVLAAEAMLQTAYISDLILKGAVDEIKTAMSKGTEPGMQTFDQSLLDLYRRGTIDMDTAMLHADSRTDLQIKMKQAVQAAAAKAAADEKAKADAAEAAANPGRPTPPRVY
jgi:twitching motility protein PilU